MWHQVSLECSFLPACKKCPWLFFPIKLLLLSAPTAWLTVVADRAHLETEFLVPVPKIRHRHVDDGERVGQRSVKFQHRPLLPRACLTPVVHRADVMRVLMRQLLPAAAPEAQCVLVAAGGGVKPGGGVEAVVGEGLLGCRAQKLQEGQLDHVGWNAV